MAVSAVCQGKELWFVVIRFVQGKLICTNSNINTVAWIEMVGRAQAGVDAKTPGTKTRDCR